MSEIDDAADNPSLADAAHFTQAALVAATEAGAEAQVLDNLLDALRVLRAETPA